MWAGPEVEKKNLIAIPPSWHGAGAFCPPRLHTHPTTTCRVLPPSLFFHSHLRTWAFGNNHILLFSSTPPPPLLSFPFFPHRALLNHATPKKEKEERAKQSEGSIHSLHLLASPPRSPRRNPHSLGFASSSPIPPVPTSITS